MLQRDIDPTDKNYHLSLEPFHIIPFGVCKNIYKQNSLCVSNHDCNPTYNLRCYLHVWIYFQQGSKFSWFLVCIYILTIFWKAFIVSCYAKSNSRFSFIAISCNQHLKTGYLFINLNLLAKWMRKFIFMGHAVCKFRFSVKIEMTSKHFLHV